MTIAIFKRPDGIKRIVAAVLAAEHLFPLRHAVPATAHPQPRKA